MSENYNDDEIIDSSEDTEKKRNKSEKFCFLCRRPESKAGPMIELPNNIHVCTDCMQKSFNSMNRSGQLPESGAAAKERKKEKETGKTGSGSEKYSCSP